MAPRHTRIVSTASSALQPACRHVPAADPAASAAAGCAGLWTTAQLYSSTNDKEPNQEMIQLKRTCVTGSHSSRIPLQLFYATALTLALTSIKSKFRIIGRGVRVSNGEKKQQEWAPVISGCRKQRLPSFKISVNAFIESHYSFKVLHADYAAVSVGTATTDRRSSVQAGWKLPDPSYPHA